MKCPYYNCTGLKSCSRDSFDRSPGAGVNLASSSGRKKKHWWKRTKLFPQLLGTSGISFFPLQGGMEDKWVLGSGPESVILEGGKERHLSINSYCSLYCRVDYPHERSCSPARDKTLAHPQPLKSQLQLDHKIQVVHLDIGHFCTYKTVQAQLNKKRRNCDSEFQDKVVGQGRTVMTPLLLDSRS